MARNFPMTWDQWKGGAKAAHVMKQTMEARIAAGEQLTEDEQILLKRLGDVTKKYSPSGRRNRAAE